MVSPLRFFQLAQKLIQLFLAGEGDAVDALQHLAMFVAAPVRARRAEELDGFDQPGARQVRTAAHVHEAVLAVEGHPRVGDTLQQFELVLLAHFLIRTDGLVARDLNALNRLVPRG